MSSLDEEERDFLEDFFVLLVDDDDELIKDDDVLKGGDDGSISFDCKWGANGAFLWGKVLFDCGVSSCAKNESELDIGSSLFKIKALII